MEGRGNTYQRKIYHTTYFCRGLQPFVRESIGATRRVQVLDLAVVLTVTRVLVPRHALNGLHRPADRKRAHTVELARGPRKTQDGQGLPDAPHPTAPAGLPLLEVVPPRELFSASRPPGVGEVGRHDVFRRQPHEQTRHAGDVARALLDSQQGESAEQSDADVAQGPPCIIIMFFVVVHTTHTHTTKSNQAKPSQARPSQAKQCEQNKAKQRKKTTTKLRELREVIGQKRERWKRMRTAPVTVWNCRNSMQCDTRRPSQHHISI